MAWDMTPQPDLRHPDFRQSLATELDMAWLVTPNSKTDLGALILAKPVTTELGMSCLQIPLPQRVRDPIY